ncbi:MAG: TrkH family potassium uptake protein [Gammaproteobacteria bacterium]
MRLIIIQKILGLLLALFSLTLVPPALISFFANDGALQAFTVALLITFTLGLILWLPVKNKKQELRLRDGFLIVVLFWTVLGLSGAIPFALAEHPNMPFTDAFFESLSGLTTTGATVIVGIDYLPVSILYYRQQLQWLGGMGIIVLAVAILPMLGIGGMQLYRAETPGPMKDNKLTPRITETAKTLWYIYLSLTIICCSAYWLSGMTFFDAICHSFSTVAIGGFSTHDASLGYFNNINIEMVAMFFMFISGINFSLHFLVWRWRSFKPYIYDSEFLTYSALLGATTIVVIYFLCTTQTYDSTDMSIRQGIFHVISIGTTTGFTTSEFQTWPSLLPLLIILLSFAGGCAGSTGGGIKVIRVLLLFKQGMREIKRLIHPNAIFPIKLANKAISDQVIDSVWGFFAVYIATFTFMFLILMATGLDQLSAFTAIAACINNLGPGLGDVSLHYGELTDAAKWILSFAMLLGRLEIFTLLVLLSPSFWRS